MPLKCFVDSNFSELQIYWTFPLSFPQCQWHCPLTLSVCVWCMHPSGFAHWLWHVNWLNFYANLYFGTSCLDFFTFESNFMGVPDIQKLLLLILEHCWTFCLLLLSAVSTITIKLPSHFGFVGWFWYSICCLHFSYHWYIMLCVTWCKSFKVGVTLGF